MEWICDFHIIITKLRSARRIIILVVTTKSGANTLCIWTFVHSGKEDVQVASEPHWGEGFLGGGTHCGRFSLILSTVQVSRKLSVLRGSDSGCGGDCGSSSTVFLWCHGTRL